ncbi:polyubiquitin-like [Tasmannia lanceolata]|uniref:polyubiquitin-like n=1 Tax=Tasmannia lanceolata TaxID=3420 RepID=UPI004063EFCC
MDATLYVVLRPWEEMQISIKMPTGKRIALDVKTWHAVQYIKAMIESMFEVLSNQQWLVHSGKQLEDHLTFLVYKIKREATLYMNPVMMHVVLKILNGETVTTLEVESSDTAHEVIPKF